MGLAVRLPPKTPGSKWRGEGGDKRGRAGVNYRQPRGAWADWMFSSSLNYHI